jgi:transcriptional regulator GlxA family with amidase domain
MERMSDKRSLLAALIEAEIKSPGARSLEVLAALRRLMELCAETATASPLDRRLLRALELMHTRLSSCWSVASLAQAAGMSRAAFARRFTRAFGVSPLQYLSELRMDRARMLLNDTEESLATIAVAVGYQSEFAFSRAFKRRFGVAPGLFRRRLRSAAIVSNAPILLLAA